MIKLSGMTARTVMRQTGIHFRDAVLEPQHMDWNNGQPLDLKLCRHWAAPLVNEALVRGTPWAKHVRALVPEDMGFPATASTFGQDVPLRSQEVEEGDEPDGETVSNRTDQSRLVDALHMFDNPEFGRPEGDIKYLIRSNTAKEDWFDMESERIKKFGRVANRVSYKSFNTGKLVRDVVPRHLHFVMTMKEYEQVEDFLDELDKKDAKVWVAETGDGDLDIFIITHLQADHVPLKTAVPKIVAVQVAESMFLRGARQMPAEARNKGMEGEGSQEDECGKNDDLSAEKENQDRNVEAPAGGCVFPASAYAVVTSKFAVKEVSHMQLDDKMNKCFAQLKRSVDPMQSEVYSAVRTWKRQNPWGDVYGELGPFMNNDMVEYDDFKTLMNTKLDGMSPMAKVFSWYSISSQAKVYGNRVRCTL